VEEYALILQEEILSTPSLSDQMLMI